MPRTMTLPRSTGLAAVGPAAGSGDRAIAEMEFSRGQQVAAAGSASFQQGFGQLFALARQQLDQQSRAIEADKGRAHQAAVQAADQQYRTAERIGRNDQQSQLAMDRFNQQNYGMGTAEIEALAKSQFGGDTAKAYESLIDRNFEQQSQRELQQAEQEYEQKTKFAMDLFDQQQARKDQDWVAKHPGEFKIAYSPDSENQLRKIFAEADEVRRNQSLTPDMRVEALSRLADQAAGVRKGIVSLNQQERAAFEAKKMTVGSFFESQRGEMRGSSLLTIDDKGNLKVQEIKGLFVPMDASDEVKWLQTYRTPVAGPGETMTTPSNDEAVAALARYKTQRMIGHLDEKDMLVKMKADRQAAAQQAQQAQQQQAQMAQQQAAQAAANPQAAQQQQPARPQQTAPREAVDLMGAITQRGAPQQRAGLREDIRAAMQSLIQRYGSYERMPDQIKKDFDALLTEYKK